MYMIILSEKIIQDSKIFSYFRELNNYDALKTAKRNVEEWYPVVGILEELNMTLTTLQQKLPKFFRGGVQKYYDGLQGMVSFQV